MSIAEISVSTSRGRPTAVDQVPGDRPGPASTSELLVRAELHALQATEEALRPGLPGIRARGLDPEVKLDFHGSGIPY